LYCGNDISGFFAGGSRVLYEMVGSKELYESSFVLWHSAVEVSRTIKDAAALV